MRNILLGAIISLTCLAGAVQADERQEHTFKVSGPVSIRLTNVSGKITVKAWDRNEVRVLSAASSRRSEASVQQYGDRIHIEASRREVSFEVMTPKNTSLEAQSRRGALSISGLSGKVDCTTTSGEIHIEDVRGHIIARTFSGDMILRNCSGDVLELNSVSGRITAYEVRGRVDGKSVSADIRVLGSRCSGLDLTTTSGDITYEGSLAREGLYSLNAHNGGLRLRLPSDVGFTITAHTFSGDIHTDFSLKLLQDMVVKKATRRTLYARYGDGKATLELKTFNGDIRLTKQ